MDQQHFSNLIFWQNDKVCKLSLRLSVLKKEKQTLSSNWAMCPYNEHNDKNKIQQMFLEVMRNLKQAPCFIISTRCRTKSQIFRFPHIKLLNKILHLALVKIAEFSGNSRKTCWSPRNKIILEFLSASPSVTTKYHIQLVLPTNWVRDWIFGSRIFGEVCFFLTQRKNFLLV